MEETRYVCRVDGCGKSFRRKEHLARHEYGHDPANMLKCPVCKREFNRKSDVPSLICVILILFFTVAFRSFVLRDIIPDAIVNHPLIQGFVTKWSDLLNIPKRPTPYSSKPTNSIPHIVTVCNAI
jgi:hypothetical protein